MKLRKESKQVKDKDQGGFCRDIEGQRDVV